LFIFFPGWRAGFTILNRRRTEKKQEMALPVYIFSQTQKCFFVLAKSLLK
jgi:hypothetical protein